MWYKLYRCVIYQERHPEFISGRKFCKKQIGMKIIHITEAWAGGISTYVKDIIEYQAQLDEFEEISLIYASNRTNANIHEFFTNFPKVKLYPYISSRNPIKFLGIARKINKTLLEVDPDIVHLHSTFPGVYGRLLKEFPTVYCSHGWSFVQEEGRLKKIIYSNVEKLLAKRTDAIINVSKHEQEQAKLHGINAELNEVILSGVRDVKFTESHELIPTSADVINIGFIGRLDYKKGFDIIEQYFRENEAKNIHLYVIGQADRDNEAAFEQCANIHYLGLVDNSHIDSYIKQLDAIIIPSRYEAFGLVALEAMRNSKPIIVSNSGALPELVVEGINGYIYNDIAKLSDILFSLDKEKLVKMGINARAMYEENFTTERMNEEMIELYYKVLV